MSPADYGINVPELVNSAGEITEKTLEAIIAPMREEASIMATYAAEEYAEVIVEYMRENITEEGINAMTREGITTNKDRNKALHPGWFEVDRRGRWRLDAVEQNYEFAVTPTGGMAGNLFETFLMGAKLNSLSIPDFQIQKEKNVIDLLTDSLFDQKQ